MPGLRIPPFALLFPHNYNNLFINEHPREIRPGSGCLPREVIDWSSVSTGIVKPTSPGSTTKCSSGRSFSTRSLPPWAGKLLAKPGWSLEYLLGIINSRLMIFYHRKKFLDEFKMRFQKILIKDCRQFPIRVIHPSDLSDLARHDEMVSLVEQMLVLNKRLPEVKTTPDRRCRPTYRSVGV